MRSYRSYVGLGFILVTSVVALTLAGVGWFVAEWIKSGNPIPAAFAAGILLVVVAVALVRAPRPQTPLVGRDLLDLRARGPAPEKEVRDYGPNRQEVQRLLEQLALLDTTQWESMLARLNSADRLWRHAWSDWRRAIALRSLSRVLERDSDARQWVDSAVDGLLQRLANIEPRERLAQDQVDHLIGACAATVLRHKLRPWDVGVLMDPIQSLR